MTKANISKRKNLNSVITKLLLGLGLYMDRRRKKVLIYFIEQGYGYRIVLVLSTNKQLIGVRG